jgi:3-hydroxyisobutyrate dehydrogenase-like beta-hydroxyacid dehydrogenase
MATEDMNERIAFLGLDGAAAGVIALTMLSDDAAVEQVALGAADLASSLPARSIHVLCSTISVALSRRLAAAHPAVGPGFVVATALGRPEAAAAVKLFILAAGARRGRWRAAWRCSRCSASLDFHGTGFG